MNSIRKLNIKDYEFLEKYVSYGIKKIIGKEFVTKDNIDEIVSKLIRNEPKFNPDKGASYNTYIFMIVKTGCFSIKKKTILKSQKNKRLFNEYRNVLTQREKNKKTEEQHKDITASVNRVLDRIEDKTLKEKIEKVFFDRKSYRVVAEEYKTTERDLRSEINKEFTKLKRYFYSLEGLLND